MYMNKFFKTQEEAKAFQKEHGGALYSNAKGSRTKQSYQVEAAMMEKTEAFREEHPFVVAWNENKTSEAQLKAAQKYKKANIKRINLEFSPAEADLWEHIQNQPKKQTYIKALIRADMEKNQ